MLFILNGNQMIKGKKNFYSGFFLILVTLIFLSKGHKENHFELLQLKASFNRIDGIFIGSDIRISGVKVGEVLNLELEKNKPILYFTLKKNVAVPNDSSISIQTDGLFGSKYLTIEPGGSLKNLDNDGQINYTEDSILIEDLLNKIIHLGKTKKDRNQI